MVDGCVYCGKGPVFSCVCHRCQEEHGFVDKPYEEWPLGVRVILEARREAVRLQRAKRIWNGQMMAGRATFFG